MASSPRIDELRKKFDENPRRYFAPLANEYRKVGDFDQAIFICQEYLPQQPGHMSGHIVFGQALFEAKRLPEARTVFETALTLDPENLIALRHLADISRDLGETAAAKGWYERVLQADPRNEEIAAIMSTLTGAAPPASPIAPTVETPVPAPKAAALSPAAQASAIAPTVELSAAAVQEMVRARQAAKEPEAPAAVTEPEMLALDATPTVEVPAGPASSALEGFESTSNEEKLDIPTGGILGLEPTSAAGEALETPAAAAAPPEGLDTLTFDDFSVPTGKAPPPPPPPAPETVPGSDGLLDFDSFELGGATPAPAPEPAAATMELDISLPEVATPAAAAASSPIDGGHDALPDFDLELPGAPAAEIPPPLPPAESLPTMVIDAIEDVVPAVVDVVQEAIPAVVDAVVNVPTVIMEAIRVAPPKLPEPPPIPMKKEPPAPPPTMREAPAVASEKAEAGEPKAPAFVTETMAQLYLEQGHRTEAIDIYRQLVAARPADAELRARLEMIERGPERPQTVETVSAATARAPEPRPQERFDADGPTIRSVLRALFGIDAMSTGGNGSGGENGGGGGEAGSIDVLFSAPPTDDLSPLAAAFDGGYVAPSGSIDAVFATDSR